MTSYRQTSLSRFIALLLVAILIIPHTAFTADAVEPRASYYLESYVSYICAMGNGELQIWYRVTGTQRWADLGVITIQLYESSDNTNWSWVETFIYTDYEQMLGHNTGHIIDYVPYEGTPGKYYIACVCIWGGDGTTGDSREYWTSSVLCT